MWRIIMVALVAAASALATVPVTPTVAGAFRHSFSSTGEVP
jgi:hypothetical protein